MPLVAIQLSVDQMERVMSDPGIDTLQRIARTISQEAIVAGLSEPHDRLLDLDAQTLVIRIKQTFGVDGYRPPAGMETIDLEDRRQVDGAMWMLFLLRVQMFNREMEGR